MSVPAQFPPHDPGLQIERTQLAWRRTALALCVVAFTSVRTITVDSLLRIVVFGLLGLAASALVWHFAERRGRHQYLAFPEASSVRMPDARLLLGVVVIVCAGSLVGIASLVVGRG